ncbi:MAG: carbohydrate kinase family protein [Anaerolineae bacterium]|nr:carbohydrate kinase family protein [Anaerolineae bacterium]
MDSTVLVIGASGVDIKARSLESLQMGINNEGSVRTSVGGVARNIAENLARLEVPTVLLSAVGEDHAGEFLMARTAAAGVDIEAVLRVSGASTGSYVALQDQSGDVQVAVSDYDVMSSISPAYLQRHRALFAGVAMIVIDASLSPRTLESVFLWAKRYGVPVCADPTSQKLANKLCKHLPDLYMLAPDAIEAAVLAGVSKSPTQGGDAMAIAQRLVSMGATIAIVTLAEQGLVYAGGQGSGHIPAIHTQVVDKTGVGDALTAAVIFGLINQMPLDDAMRLGVSAAAITLRTRETVVPDLSLDQLYNQLVV